MATNGDVKIPRSVSMYRNGKSFLPSEESSSHARISMPFTPRLYLQNRLEIRPLFTIGEAMFTSYVHKNLIKMGITEIFKIQAYAWPLIMFGEPVMMISSPKTGKTMAYLPALCSKVSYPEIRNVDRGLSPTSLILVPTVRDVESTYSLIRKIDPEKKLKVIRVHQWSSKRAISALPNGWDIVIATPVTYLQLLSYGTVTTVNALGFLILDDVAASYKETLSILRFCHQKIQDGDIQIVITCQNYAGFIIDILKHYEMSYMFGAHLEAAVYAGVNFKFQFIQKNAKNYAVCKILEKELHDKVLIVCEDMTQVMNISTVISCASIPHFRAHEYTPGKEIDSIYAEWKSASRTNSFVLVCSDSVLTDFNITDASAVIHYSLPSTWTGFTYRFSYMMGNYKSSVDDEERNGQNCFSYSLIDEDSVKKLPRIISFIERMGCDVGDILRSIVKKELIRREQEKANKGVPLCESVQLIGKCNTANVCSKRHLIVPSDSPAKYLPVSGDFKLNVLRIIDVNLYVARIMGHRLNRKEKWSLLKVKHYTSARCNLYFNNLETPANLVDPKVGYLCAVDLGEGIFERCKILQIFDKGHMPVQVQIDLIDTGELRNLSSTTLVELPEHLKIDPPNVVYIRIAGIKPHDDCYWSREAVRAVTKIMRLPVSAKEFFISKIQLILENTVWVDDLCKSEVSSGCEVCTQSMRREILDQNIGVSDSQHIDLLKEMCKAAGLLQVTNDIGAENQEIHIVKEDDFNISKQSIDVKKDIDLSEDSKDREGDQGCKKTLLKAFRKNKPSKVCFMLALEKAMQCNGEDSNVSIKQTCLKMEKLRKNIVYQVYLTYAVAPSLFYVQMMSEAKRLQELTNDIQIYMREIGHGRILSDPQTNDFCLASSCEGIYNRAQVLSVSEKRECTVLFIDFGDTITTSKVYDIHLYLQKIPPQAIKCGLYGVVVCEDKFDDALDFLYSKSGVTWSAEIIDIISDAENSQCHLVNISCEGNSDTLNKLLMKGFGTSDQDKTKLKLPQGINSVDDVFNYFEEMNLVEEEPDNDDKAENCFDVVNIMNIVKDGMAQKDNGKCEGQKTIKKNVVNSAMSKIVELSQDNVILDTSNTTKGSHSKCKSDCENATQNSIANNEVLQLNTRKVLPPLLAKYHTPKIIWSQNESDILIKVQLWNVKDYELKISDYSHIYFKTVLDNKTYSFSLELSGPVVPKLTRHYATGTCICIRLVKYCQMLWSALQHADKKPAWISYSFCDDIPPAKEHFRGETNTTGATTDSVVKYVQVEDTETDAYNYEEMSDTVDDSSDSEIGEHVFDVLE